MDDYTKYMDELLEAFIQALGDSGGGLIVNLEQEEAAREVKVKFLAERFPSGETWGTRLIRLSIDARYAARIYARSTDAGRAAKGWRIGRLSRLSYRTSCPMIRSL